MKVCWESGMYNQECTKTLSVCNCINYIFNNSGARPGRRGGRQNVMCIKSLVVIVLSTIVSQRRGEGRVQRCDRINYSFNN